MTWTLETITPNCNLIEADRETAHPCVRLRFIDKEGELDKDGYPPEFYYHILLDQEVPTKG